MYLLTESLTKIYKGRKVVNDVSIKIGRSEVVGLLGPNGAGKTTTFYMIVGLLKPDRGRVYIDDEDITEYPMYKRARKGICYLPQEPSIFRKLTVEENILAILETMKINREEMNQRLKELLEELNLTHLSKQKGFQLSGGERRRTEITRALVTSPKFILLDEPFAGIDPIAVSDIQGIVKKLKEKGIGVVISDHNVRETLQICDRAYIINNGRVIKEGSPDEIVKSEIAREVYLGKNFTL